MSNNPKETQHVILDFDSIIFPIVDCLREVSGDEKICMENIKKYEDLAELAGGQDNFLKLFSETTKYDNMIKHSCIDGSSEAVSLLNEHRYEFIIATKRPLNASADTKKYLDANNINYSRFFCAPNIDKLNLANYFSAVAIIDDDPTLLTEVQNTNHFGISLSYDYNKHVFPHDSLFEASHWEEIVNHLLLNK